MIERLDYTREEWNQLPTQTRVELLNKEDERRRLEGAITEMGRLVGQNPDYKRYWSLIKSKLDRTGIQLKIH